ncbi:MAG: methyltetrahydrofolate cobalamin methyltransferase [Desulfobacterales bacterium]
MLIVGELINASRKPVALAIKEQDSEAIGRLADDQYKNGADYIDVNAGVFVEKEADYLKWIVRNVQKESAVPCCIDSPNPDVIETALSVHQGRAMINSISLEKKRLDAMLPLVAGSDLKVVALCMGDEGMPETADERIAIAEELVNKLVQNNVPLDNIYVDPLVQPVATNKDYGVEFLTAIEQIMRTFDGCHTICGLSNISYGLPERKLLNQTFVSMAIEKGLDAAIINPLDKVMTGSISAALALSGRDDFCMNYIKAYREGDLP